MGTIPIPQNDNGLSGYMWPTDRCPKCGSLYFEWLSYDIEPKDVYLNSEWLPKPHVRLHEFWPGKVVIHSVDSSRGSLAFNAEGGTYRMVFDTS